MGYTPYKMKASGHNNSPIEKNYGSKSNRGFGVPFTGGVGSDEMESGVGDKFEGMPYSTKASPNKGIWDSIKKIGGKMLDPLGIKNKAKKALGIGGGGGDTKALEGRVAALEASSSGGGATAPSIGTDPAMAALGMSGAGDGAQPVDQAMMKKKKMAEGWGGAGSVDPVKAVTAMSDIRLKEKIEKAGKSPSGIPIYVFSYIGDNRRYEGAMAQDLISMGIDAVETQESGYYSVDYSKIDVDMKLIN